ARDAPLTLLSGLSPLTRPKASRQLQNTWPLVLRASGATANCSLRRSPRERRRSDSLGARYLSGQRLIQFWPGQQLSASFTSQSQLVSCSTALDNRIRLQLTPIETQLQRSRGIPLWLICPSVWT